MGQTKAVKNKIRLNFTIKLLIAAVIFLLVFFVCAAVGSVGIPFDHTVRALLNAFGIGDVSDISEGTVKIITNVRVPRILIAALCGAALAGAGAAMQGLLKNPLADGSTLGVATGGTLGAVIVIALGLSPAALGSFALPVVSMLFSFGFLMLVVFTAYGIDRKLSGMTVILCGVIFSMLAAGIISLIIALSGDKLDRIVFWTMGSFAGKDFDAVLVMLVFCAAGLGVVLWFSRELNILSLGEEQASFLGVRTKSVKLWIMAACAVLIGVSVAFCGAIGFVGLAVPHITRMFTGPDHKKMLPLNIFTGAVFMMITDLIARTIISPLELPVGVITQIIGAAVFIAVFALLRKKRTKI